MRYILVAFTNPVDGREEEFNEWYDRQHVPDVLEVPGFVSAQRFVCADSQMSPVQHKYFTIYEIESEGIDTTLAAFGARAREGKIVMTDAVDSTNAAMCIYEPLGEAINPAQASQARRL